MQMILLIFGWSCTFGLLLAVVVPYLRRRADLMTSWNLFLLGCANFMGFAAVQSANSPRPYANYTTPVYVHFLLGAVLFLVVVFFAYYKIQFPRRAAARRLRLWPPANFGVFFSLLIICLMLSVIGFFAPNVQFIGQILILAGRSGALLAFPFAFVLWLRQPINPILAVTLMIVSIAGAFFAIVGQTGRRELLSLALTVPICWYWTTLRYRQPGMVFFRIGIVSAFVVLLIAAYTSIRHRDPSVANTTVGYAVESVKELPGALLGLQGTDRIIGGDSVESSLLAIDTYYLRGNTEPFFSVIYVLLNPVPRAWWPDKPVGLGVRLPVDSNLYARLAGSYNLGPGIVGHCFHEGGYFMVVFYALAIGVTLRFFDDLMVNQPGNPFFPALLAGSSGQILALSRGEFGLFILLIIAVLGTGWFLTRLARLFSGTVLMGLASSQVAPLEEAYSNAVNDHEYGSQHVDRYGY